MLAAAIALLLLMLLVAVVLLDASRYVIPNKLVLAMLLLYVPVPLLVVPDLGWLASLAVAAGCLLLGFGLFAIRLMGGGDAKLIAVAGLWAGLGAMVDFLLLMGILGGALALALLLSRGVLALWMPWLNLPRILRQGEPIPYGVAIAASLATLLFTHRLPVGF